MKFAGRFARDAQGIAHIQAFIDYDAAYLNGWVHAQDRIMDPDHRGLSNEWAIARSLPATGNSMIPYLSLRMPSIFHPLVMRGARINAAGVGFPVAPLVVQGHNDRIAWGQHG